VGNVGNIIGGSTSHLNQFITALTAILLDCYELKFASRKRGAERDWPFNRITLEL